MTAVTTRDRRLEHIHAQVWPLWRDVATAMPEVVLEPLAPPGTDSGRTSVPGGRYTAYRMVVELSDAVTRLCAEHPAAVATAWTRVRAETTTPHRDHVAAVVVGEVLAAELPGLHTGRGNRATTDPTAGRSPVCHHEGLVADLDWWRLVAMAYDQAVKHRYVSALLAA